ncbi:LuxR family two component transcriptional regulator [Nocardia tenerifensis]|uniref:LuxR family two component transcriptional regulator n=1 Tax=Nocardia tenerifensis TaxID=228006 RepID=A0A318KAQ9_9NOCA|nr:response regulator transcription factor [Nocardia tenerifensis]PXX66885.1 LuxR family two component transcriptional regulator [Nocardia tenerifensis]
MSARIRVVVVDDEPLARSALTLILGGDPELELVGEAADGEQALAVIAEQSPDIVLMDIRMPVRDGLDATRELLSRADPPRVLVLTTFDADDMVLRALRIGAHGFLLKDTPPADIVAAVKQVAAGRPMLSPSVTAQLISVATARPSEDDAARERARSALASLTERERDVAEAIGRGLSNSDIAKEMHLSIATVKSYTSRLLTKLDAENRVQIAIVVLNAGRGRS